MERCYAAARPRTFPSSL